MTLLLIILVVILIFGFWGAVKLTAWFALLVLAALIAAAILAQHNREG